MSKTTDITLHSPRGALSIVESAAYLSISRSQLYALMREGSIKPIKIGSRTIITITELDRFLASRQAAA